MKTIHTIKIKLLSCDNCEKPVEDTKRQWLKGAFQTGTNKENKIGTWCSEKCFEEYQTKYFRSVIEEGGQNEGLEGVAD